MIVGIKGTLYKSSPLNAVIETASGLFYDVYIPITTAEKLPQIGSEVFLHTLAVYREDSQSLYGFTTTKERDFFKILVEKVSGIGPKTAINILSRMSVDTLKGAIASGDVSLLSKCPGIGKKTAERLIVELKDLAGSSVSVQSSSSVEQVGQNTSYADAVSALAALGYKIADADKAVRKAAEKLGENASTEELLKQAFKA